MVCSKPRRAKSETDSIRSISSSLFTTRSGVFPIFLNFTARVSSSGTSPSLPSTTKRRRSAAKMAKSAWSSVACWISVGVISGNIPIPPVSMRAYPSGLSATTTSRVTPGRSWTMEIRRPASRLNKRLLPTFGRPTMATLCVKLIFWEREGETFLPVLDRLLALAFRGEPFEEGLHPIGSLDEVFVGS